MKPLKFISVILVSALLASCNLNINLGKINGNGNVISEERPVTEDFHKVKGSTGLDVYLTQGSENKIVVEADENLQEVIETEISNGKLSIHTNENIGSATSKKVFVTYKNIDHVYASSGADVIVNSVLKNEYITLDVSSGSDLEVEVFAREVTAESSSGADIKVSGKATSLFAKSSSGSEIDAEDLIVLTCNADASSGGDITVHVKEKLTTEATSGGSIEYYGNPTAFTNDSSRSGNVHKM